MASFKFNFSSFSKPKIKSERNLPRREIINRNVIGVIGIYLDASYYVEIDGTEYRLTIESYELKGKNVYYAKTLNESKTLEIIRLGKRVVGSRNYLPFAVGSIVKGNIYKILGTPRFNISKILELKDVPNDKLEYFKDLRHKHKQFYRDNYEEILKCMN